MHSTVNTKYKILNREAIIISGLITNGLCDLRKISENHSYYYQSFFELSMGLERLLKLIVLLDNASIDISSFRHNLVRLLESVDVNVDNKSVEFKMLSFLSDFAMGDRYNIIDYLSSGDMRILSKEPIVMFHNNVLREVLMIHPPSKIMQLSDVDISYIFHIREDLSEINSLNDLLAHGQVVNHASKYCVIYVGRLLQPLLAKLADYDGPPNNPFFSEHFRFLRQDDSYFKRRKTYYG